MGLKTSLLSIDCHRQKGTCYSCVKQRKPSQMYGDYPISCECKIHIENAAELERIIKADPERRWSMDQRSQQSRNKLIPSSEKMTRLRVNKDNAMPSDLSFNPECK